MARRIKTNTLMARGEGGRFTGKTERGEKILQRRAEKYALRVETRLIDQHEKVLERMRKNSVYSLKGAAYIVSQMAKARIVTAAKPSKPGQSPHTKGKPKSLRAAIAYSVNKEMPDAYIGPTGTKIGTIGRLHESGGVRGKAKYSPRPFMAPALEESLDRFVGQWRGSLGR